MIDSHDKTPRTPDWPSPPYLTSLALRWHLLTNPAVMIGSFFFGLGIVFALALGTNTGVIGTVLLAWDRGEAPGWLDRVSEMPYEENEERVYRYDYRFRLPDGTQRAGSSYWPGRHVREPAAGAMANPARPPDATIEYCRGNPEISRLQGTRTGMCAPWVTFVFIFPAVGLPATWGGLAHGRRRIRLLEDGQLARATFTSARVVDHDEEGIDPALIAQALGPGRSAASGDSADDGSDSPDDEEQLANREPVELTDQRMARHMATRFLLMGLFGIGVMLAIFLQGGGAGWPMMGQVFFGLAAAAVTFFALLIYFARSRLAELMCRRVRLARQGGSVEDFQRFQVEEQEHYVRKAQPLRGVGMFFLTLWAIFLSVWFGLVFALVAGFVAFVIQRQRGYQFGNNIPAVEAFVAISAFILAAGMAMQFILRWLRRREKAHAAGLLPVRETSVECTYTFTLPDGRIIERKDQLRLPMGPEEEIPHLVLYDPRKPQNAVRLFGISPAVRLNAHGEWQADVNAGLAMIRLAFALICYTAGPLAGWFAKAAIGQ